MILPEILTFIIAGKYNIMINLPFSEACEQNKAPILAILKQYFTNMRFVLEI